MPIEILPFDSARDFLDALRPTHERWSGAWPPRKLWIYRGQASADWDLLPRLWRKDAPSVAKPWWAAAWNECETFGKQMKHVEHDVEKRLRLIQATTVLLTERRGVMAFVDLANELGYAVDPFDPKRPNEIERLMTSVWNGSTDQPDDLTALAQHHGVPTRLLDWTRRSLVAAFFAADDAWQRNREVAKPEQKIAVWAVHAVGIPDSPVGPPGGSRIRLLDYPAHANDFLRAQDGVFGFDAFGDGQFVQTGHRLVWEKFWRKVSLMGAQPGCES